MFPECFSESTISSLIILFLMLNPHMLLYFPSMSLSFSLLCSFCPDPTAMLPKVLEGFNTAEDIMTQILCTVLWHGRACCEHWLEVGGLFWGSLIGSEHAYSLTSLCMGRHGLCDWFCSLLTCQLLRVSQVKLNGSRSINVSNINFWRWGQ